MNLLRELGQLTALEVLSKDGYRGHVKPTSASTAAFQPWLMASLCVLLLASVLELRLIASLTALNASLAFGAAYAFRKRQYLHLAAGIIGITLASYIKAHAPSVASYGGTESVLLLTGLLQALCTPVLLWWFAWPRKPVAD